MHLPETFENLVDQAQGQELYVKLIKQLNKDFQYANLPVDFEEDISPENLKSLLHEKIYRLISEKFSDYLNLLYIIDVPEKQVKQLDGSDTVLLSEQVAFLILKREWQKVWFRNKYS